MAQSRCGAAERRRRSTIESNRQLGSFDRAHDDTEQLAGQMRIASFETAPRRIAREAELPLQAEEHIDARVQAGLCFEESAARVVPMRAPAVQHEARVGITAALAIGREQRGDTGFNPCQH